MAAGQVLSVDPHSLPTAPLLQGAASVPVISVHTLVEILVLTLAPVFMVVFRQGSILISTRTGVSTGHSDIPTMVSTPAMDIPTTASTRDTDIRRILIRRTLIQ